MGKEKEKVQVKESSWVNKLLIAFIVILVAFNIKLFLNRGQSDIQINLIKGSNGIFVDHSMQFIKDSGIVKLSNELTQHSSNDVQTLELKLQMSSMTENGLQNLLTSIEKYQNLRNLTLNIGNNPLSNSSAQLVAQTLGRLNNLETLNLGLDSVFDHNGREAIFKSLAKLPKLNELKVSLIHIDLSGKGLVSLFPISGQKQLKSLDLILVGCKLKQEEAVHLQTLLAKLPKLEKLGINLYANKIHSDGAITLSGGLHQQKQLKSLELDLFFNNITVNGTETLSGVLKEMKNLTNLNLNLEFNFIEDKGGVYVGDAISNLTLLRTLSLNVATKNFGWIGYEAILNSLTGLTHLEELDLNTGVNKCGAKGAELLKQQMERHNKLKMWRFNYLENYVGDQGAKHVADGLRKLEGTEDLQVGMAFNSLSNRGALELAKAVETVKQAKVLRSNC